jgi:outer membrane protein assembly factor BamD
MPRLRSLLVLFVALVTSSACFRNFNVRNFPSSAALYRAGLEQYEKGKYGNAIEAFERLTFDLPTRDTLLPRAHWWLGQARRKNDERLLAAQSFSRVAEQFPNDSLADDAMYMAGISYRELWRRPTLDPQYGILAQSQFRLVQGVYADSPFADSAQRQLAELDEWFATKDFETGLHYVRRRAYDSALIYFRDVVTEYPNTDVARKAMLEMVRVFRLPAMNYQQDAAEICEALRGGFPTDPDVLAACRLPVDSAASDGR